MDPEEDRKEKNDLPVDRGWAWMIVVAFFGCTFFMVGIAKSFGIVMQELIVSFDTEVAKAASVMGAAAGIYTLAAPFALAFGQQLGQRPVVIFGGCFGGVLIALCFSMVSIEFIIVMFGIGGGIANACLFGNGLVMLGMYFRKHASLANAMALTGASIGQFALPPVLDLLLATYGLAGTFLFIAGFYFHVCVFASLYRPLSFYEKRKQEKVKQANSTEIDTKLSNTDHKPQNGTPDIEIEVKEKLLSEDKPSPHRNFLKLEYKQGALSSTGSLVMGSIESLAQVVQTEEMKKPKQQGTKFKLCGNYFVFPKLFYWHVLTMGVVIFYTSVSFCVFFGYFNFIVFMPLDASSRPYLRENKSWLVSIAGVGDLIGRIIVGVVGDTGIVQRYNIMAFVCTMCGINIIIFGFASNFIWCAVHAGLYGMFGGAYVAINPVVLVDLVGLELMPQVLGVVLLIQGLGAAMGQPIQGGVKDYTGSYESLNYINGVLLIFGGCLLFSYPLMKKFVWKQGGKTEEGQGQQQTNGVDQSIDVQATEGSD